MERRKYDVKKALEIAYETGQQITIGLRSGVNLEGVIIEKLWETSFRVWLNLVNLLKILTKLL
jgi:hypothetical protein